MLIAVDISFLWPKNFHSIVVIFMSPMEKNITEFAVWVSVRLNQVHINITALIFLKQKNNYFNNIVIYKSSGCSIQ